MEEKQKEYLKEYQQRLLSMLLSFDAFCREHDLEYFLAGGSAIGAVRHAGFIPWDDDIDLAMLRPDFERMETIIKENGNQIGQYVYSPVQDQIVPDAPIGHLFDLPGVTFAGSGKKRKVTGRYGYNLADAPMLDIHPIDGVWKNGLLKKVQRFFAVVHYMSVYRLPTKNKGKAAHVISGILVKLTPDFLFDFYASVSRKIISMRRADKAEYVCSLFGLAGYEREVMKKELLLPYQRVPFAGHSLPIPAKERDYLNRLYGDFERLPAKEARVPKHTGYERFMEALHGENGYKDK